MIGPSTKWVSWNNSKFCFFTLWDAWIFERMVQASSLCLSRAHVMCWTWSSSILKWIRLSHRFPLSCWVIFAVIVVFIDEALLYPCWSKSCTCSITRETFHLQYGRYLTSPQVVIILLERVTWTYVTKNGREFHGWSYDSISIQKTKGSKLWVMVALLAHNLSKIRFWIIFFDNVSCEREIPGHVFEGNYFFSSNSEPFGIEHLGFLFKYKALVFYSKFW